MTTWINLMIRHRYWVMGAVLAVTIGLIGQMRHLEIIVSSDNMIPQSNHYIRTGNEIEDTFGHKYTVAIAVTATHGTIYQTPILEKVKRITARITKDPMVIKSSVTGLAARKVKGIAGNEEGMTVNAFMDKVPQDQRGIDALKKAVASNPVYDDLLVSKDRLSRSALSSSHRQVAVGGCGVRRCSGFRSRDPESIDPAALQRIYCTCGPTSKGARRIAPEK